MLWPAGSAICCAEERTDPLPQDLIRILPDVNAQSAEVRSAGRWPPAGQRSRLPESSPPPAEEHSGPCCCTASCGTGESTDQTRPIRHGWNGGLENLVAQWIALVALEAPEAPLDLYYEPLACCTASCGTDANKNPPHPSLF